MTQQRLLDDPATDRSELGQPIGSDGMTDCPRRGR